MYFNAQLLGDHMRERRLTQTGRTVEQDVIHGLVALPGRLDGDAQLLFGLLLTQHLGQGGGTLRMVKFAVSVTGFGIYWAVIHIFVVFAVSVAAGEIYRRLNAP